MGIVVTKMKLSNLVDLGNAEAGLITPDAVRMVEVDAIADTGAIGLAIPEDVAEALNLRTIRHDWVQTADGKSHELPIVAGIFLELLDRSMSTDAFVLPRGAKVLLGAVQLEWMDLVVVPKTQEVIPNPAHPNGPKHLLLRAS
jgi:clan AA aspartic protease